MKTLTENLKVWRKKRNIINPNTSVFVANVIEELLEIFHDDKQEIKFLQNEIMDLYFDKEPISELNTTDAIQDIQVFCINETELMDYDNLKCNDEVFKEISSREQDPQQKEEWAKNGANGKWLKSELEEHKVLWYKADYSKCKL